VILDRYQRVEEAEFGFSRFRAILEALVKLVRMELILLVSWTV